MRLKSRARDAVVLARLGLKDSAVALMIARVIHERLSYLEVDALVDLAEVALEIEKESLPGGLVEAGCALGGSALVIAAAKERSRPFSIFDVFDTIPPPSEKDGHDVQARYELIVRGESKGIGGDTYYGYQADLRRRVERTFAAHGLPIGSNSIRLVPGLFQDTLPSESGAVAVAHIDGDWYESVAVCLEAIAPRLVVGGRIIVDDYDAWSGCRRAVDEFLAAWGGESIRLERRSRLHLVRRD